MDGSLNLLSFYNSREDAIENPDNPTGRVWVLPYSKGYMMFNCYGRNININSASNILAKHVGMESVKDVTLYMTATYVNNQSARFVSETKRSTYQYNLGGGKWKLPRDATEYINTPRNYNRPPDNVLWYLIETEGRYSEPEMKILLDHELALWWKPYKLLGTYRTMSVAKMRMRYHNPRLLREYVYYTESESEKENFVRGRLTGSGRNQHFVNRAVTLLDSFHQGRHTKTSHLEQGVTYASATR